MLRLVPVIFMLLLFQACQVSEKVADSNIIPTDLFPGSTLKTALPADGWKKLGDTIDISLIFPLPITVTGAPYIDAVIGSTTRRFNFNSGSGTGVLKFRYTVTAADLDTDGIIISPVVKLNSGTMIHSLNKNVPLNLTIPQNKIQVDGVIPFLTQMRAPSSGNYATAQELKYDLTYSENVLVSGVPEFNMNLGSGSVPLKYKLGSGSTNLEFYHELLLANTDSDGFTTSNFLNLNPAAEISIQDEAGNVASSTIFPTTSKNLYKDLYRPSVLEIIRPVPAVYMAGQQLDYTINFSHPVLVTGTPSIPIVANQILTSASYVSGSGTSSLVLRHTVQGNPVFSSEVAILSPLTLNSGTIKNLTNTYVAVLDFSAGDILININKPSIISVIPPAPMTYTLGQAVNFTVLYSEAVNVTGTPAIQIALSTGVVNATYAAGSGTSTLTYTYTVQLNDVDADGISLLSPALARGGTIKNLTGDQTASMNYSIPATGSINIEAASGPYVTLTIPPTNNTYTEASTLNFDVSFNSPVTVGGNPKLPIIVGATTVFANYSSSVNPSTLRFSYTPTTAHEDLDGITLSGPIDLSDPGSSLMNAGKAAVLTYTPPNTTGILVDGTSPALIAVTASGLSRVVAGQEILFSARFSEPVVVSGSPSLSIVIGAITRAATYVAGPTSDTVNFKYVIQVGEVDSDGIDIISPLNPGTGIQDLRGHNAAVIFAPFNHSGILIDATAPRAQSLSATNGTYKIGDVLTFTVNWDEPTYISGSPRLSLLIGGTPVYASYVVSGGASTTSVFTYTVQASHSAPIGISTTGIDLNGATLRDSFGNNANLNFLIAPNLNLVNIDGVVPFITLVTPPTNATYKTGQTLDFTLTWSENINLIGTPELRITIGTTEVIGSFYSATVNTTTFSYSVSAGELDTNGIALLNTIVLGTGVSVKDVNGNNAYLQINAPDLRSVKVDAITPTIAAIIPPENKTFKVGEPIDFKFIWSEPVIITGAPRLQMVIGATSKAAVYDLAQSTTTTSVFRYTVVAGDLDTNGITISTPIDLITVASTIRDAATNSAVVSFNVPVLTAVLVDGLKANVDPANPLTAPTSQTFYAGGTIFFQINWTAAVTVNTTLGIPYINLRIGSTIQRAYYSAGAPATSHAFNYIVSSGEFDGDGIEVMGPVVLNGGTIRDIGAVDADLTFTPSTILYPSLLVDAVSPVALSAASSNLTRPAKPNYFIGNDVLRYTISFDKNVTVTGAPRLNLDIGGVLRNAAYSGGSTTKVLTFDLTLDPAELLLDLDGINVTTAIDLNGGSITDTAGNPFLGLFPFSEKDYVYYTNMVARYHLDGANYSSAICNSSDQCVTGIKDITGNNNDLVPVGTGPVVSLRSVGTQTSTMQFNNLTSLRTAQDMSVQYAVFVLKTVNNASITNTISTHALLTRKASAGPDVFTPAIRYTSDTGNKSILMDPTQSVQINNNGFSGFTAVVSTPTLWAADTEYIVSHIYSAPTIYLSGSSIAGTTFNGQIAEIIFLSGTPAQADAQINRIQLQLNTIHGVY